MKLYCDVLYLCGHFIKHNFIQLKLFFLDSYKIPMTFVISMTLYHHCNEQNPESRFVIKWITVTWKSPF